MGDARHSYSGPSRMWQRVRMEAAQQDTTESQAYPQQPQWDTGYEGGYSEYQGGSSSYYPHGIFGLKHRVGTSASTRYPNWYYPLERYVSYGADQAKRTVQGVGWLQHTVEEHRSSVDSQTDMINSLFGHLGFDPNTSILQRFMFGGRTRVRKYELYIVYPISLLFCYLFASHVVIIVSSL
jgi:hypothetical protein